MNTISIVWTDPMRRVLAELQQRPLLQYLLGYAERHGVELYVVGGSLRDIGLGRLVHDIDVAMTGDVMRFAREFANHLGAAYVPMDTERGEVRVVYRKRHVLDFARMRGANIVTDLQYRDFTINAMACPLAALLTQSAPALIDPHGGWHDLRARIIRVVSATSFRDDPLRLLRAFRLAATLELTIEPLLLAAMKTIAPHLIDVAAERIHSELFKLLAAPKSGPHVATMAHLGMFDVLLPELAATRGIPCQPDDQVDVFAHAVQTYEAVEDLINDPGSHLPTLTEAVLEYFRAEERQALVKWAALLHVLEERAQPWEHLGNRLKWSRKQSDAVKTLLAHYGRTFELASLEAEGRLTLRTVHGWCKEVGESLVGILVLALGHAIARGQAPTSEPGITSLAHLAAHVWELHRRHILPVMTAPRLVTGDDLQQIFHLTPGPRFKVLLDELEVAQVEGSIRTRAEALQWVAGQVG